MRVLDSSVLQWELRLQNEAPMIFELEAWRQRLLEVINGATPHGGYAWKDSKDFGIPEDITYLGKPWLTKFKSDGTETHCSGATLWAFCKTYKALLGEMTPLQSLTMLGMKQFQRLWFGAEGKGNVKCAIDALSFAGVGMQLVPEQARALDFAQIWRHDGSGHSIIVMSKSPENLLYWSSNQAFKDNPAGMGFKEEKLSNIRLMYVSRVGKDINTIAHT